MTLLLGPPGSGKTTLLLALAGKLSKDLKVRHRTNMYKERERERERERESTLNLNSTNLQQQEGEANKYMCMI
jgi:GTPase SAR1 family protein